MQTILLPIQKKYCDKIFSGQKCFEFRKAVPSRRIGKILVYESRGRGMVVGELLIKDIIDGSIEEIWRLTGDRSGIGYNEFIRYFKGKGRAYAYRISKCIEYDSPRSIAEYGLSRAPQNFMWIER